jgi:hypothetical protein
MKSMQGPVRMNFSAQEQTRRPSPTVIWTNRSSSEAASEPDNAARATCPRLPNTQEDKNELDQKNTPHNNDVEQRPSFGHDRINHRSFV